MRCAIAISGAALFILIFVVLANSFFRGGSTGMAEKDLPQIQIQTKLLEKNEYSRPGKKLTKVNGIVVHYTANPGTDAIDNRNYFNGLTESNATRKKPIYASSHFIIGLEGQIVQCVPLSEIAYASNNRNKDTISIECCHPGKNGKFNEATRSSLKELLVYLCLKFGLTEDDIIRHYDVTGKLCPLYYVRHEDKWKELKKEVGERL